MTAKRPADFEQRMLALDPERSFLCEAPAGSGKTELLSQRFLTLLGGVARPEELLAITFTRKATAAMRERIIGALLRAQCEAEPDNEYQRITWRAARRALAADARYGWDLLSNPQRLQIRTFDSLCVHLSGALPLHSTFGAQPEVTEDPDELYRLAVRQLFQDLESGDRWADSLAVVLRHLDNNFSTLERLLIGMLHRREEWLPLLGRGGITVIRNRLERHLQHVCDDVVARLKRGIPASLQARLLELAAYAAANMKQSGSESAILECLDLTPDRLPDSSSAGIRCWFGIMELLTTSKGDWRAAVNKRIGFPSADRKADQQYFRQRKQQMLDLMEELRRLDGLQEALYDLRYLPAVQYREQQLEVLQALTDILPVLTAHLTLVFRDRNCVDFTEVNIRARTALGGLETPTDLALALDHRIRHILVDEFQDVSTAQVVLLRQLTAGWQAGDGHTLFCVGDAMQSIYGFRDANVGVFIHCEEHGLGDIPLEYLRLNTNFRSHAGLVEWLNAVFAPAFPAQNDIPSGAVRFSPSVAFEPGGPARAVDVFGFTGDEAAEAQRVLEIIDTTRRETPAASIAVLVRSRRHAGHIVARLQRAGVGYRAVDLEPLADHTVIRDLLSLCRALLHPADRIAWLAVLRAPWCGLTLADLLALTQCAGNARDTTVVEQLQFVMDSDNAGQGAAARLTADAMARLARAAPVLFTALEEMRRKPLREWLEGVWLELGGPACLDDPADLDNAEKFFSLVEELDSGGSLPQLDSLEKAVAGLYAAPDPAAGDKLQVMTIHKAKGLEFDVVIVPSLQRTPRPATSDLILWQERLTAEGKSELLLAPIPARGDGQDRIYQYLQQERKKKAAFENCRLLYVACTRARQRLYLLAGVKQDEKTAELRAPARTSLLRAVWDSLRPELQLLTDRQDAITSAPVLTGPGSLRRLPGDWQLPGLTRRDQLANLIEPFDSPDFPAAEDETITAAAHPDGVGQDPTARHVGTVVHQILQEVGQQGLAFWTADRIEQGRPYRRARLAALGVAPADLEKALREVERVMAAVLRDERFTWMFADRHAVRYCEYPVTVATRQAYRNLVIDLLVQEQNGDTWVIDYKTGRPGPGVTVEAFIRQRLDFYRSTMEQYRQAVSELGYSNVRAALYFPLLARWVEYDDV